MSSRQKFFQSLCIASACLASLPLSGQTPVSVPDAPPVQARAQNFHDSHFGVRFKVPKGWALQRKDGEVSTFHLDARTATPDTQMRSVAAIEFNPYPFSTLSGALFYFSVQKHSTDAECSRQASAPNARANEVQETQDIDGMNFAHGHDEHGKICVEARDEVYTAYRKGSCYRFDLAMNTFCSVSSGAADLTAAQLQDIDGQMNDILASVRLDWEKNTHGSTQAKAVSTPVTGPVESTAAITPLMEQGAQ